MFRGKLRHPWARKKAMFVAMWALLKFGLNNVSGPSKVVGPKGIALMLRESVRLW